MNKSVSVFVRALVALLIVGLLFGGAGMLGYRMGVAQGIEQAPEVAAAIERAAENGQPVVPMYGYGYPHAFGYRPHHFNPFAAVCFSIFFLFLFFGLMKALFFRRMRHGWGHHGHWKKDWEGGVPPMFDEWHKRAHGESETEKPASPDGKEQ